MEKITRWPNKSFFIANLNYYYYSNYYRLENCIKSVYKYCSNNIGFYGKKYLN
jgi:hypothetical protein